MPECKALQFFHSGEFLPILHLAVFSTISRPRSPILERARDSLGGRFSAAIAILPRSGFVDYVLRAKAVPVCGGVAMNFACEACLGGST